MGYCDWYKENVQEYVGGPDPFICQAKDAAGDAVADAAGDAWSNIVNTFAEGAAEIVKDMATFWMKVDAPGLNTESGPIGFMFDNTLWLTSFMAVLGLLLAAGRMAWERRAEPAREAAVALIRMVLSSTAVVAGISLALKAGDEFSTWIVNRATQCGSDTASDACLKAFTRQIITNTAWDGGGGGMLALVFILSLLLMISSLLQIAFMLARNAMLILLVGTLPLTAAASSTPQGRQAWQKSLSVTIACVLYKPAGAIVFAGAAASAGTTGKNDTITQVSGIVLLTLSALTLPALIRVVAPLTDAVAGGQRGAGSVIGSAAAAVATGAIAVKTMGASSAAGGGRGASGAQGPGGGTGPGQGGGPTPTPQGGGGPQGGNNSPSPQGGNGGPGGGTGPGQGGGPTPTPQGGASTNGQGGNAPHGSGPGGQPAPNGQTRTVPRPTTNGDGGPRGSN